MTFVKFALARFALSSRLAGCEMQCFMSQNIATNLNISRAKAHLQADVTNDALAAGNF
nr:hypothetical protein [Rhodoferax sp.]